MNLFYLILLIPSCLLLIGEIFYSLLFHKDNFGEKREMWVGVSDIIPLEIIFPKNFRITFIFIIIFALTGRGLYNMGMGNFSLVGGFVAAIIANALIMKVLLPFKEDINGTALPSGEKLFNIEAVVVEDIINDDYGEIAILYKGKTHYKKAISVNQTPLIKGEKVLILFEEGDICFIQGINEVYDYIDE